LRKQKLSEKDRKLWNFVKQKLRIVVNRSDVFKKTFGAKSGSAICLIVRAYGSRYGFCTYLFLLIPNKDKRWKKFDRLVSEEEKEKLRREKKTILKENKKKAKEESKQKKLRKQKALKEENEHINSGVAMSRSTRFLFWRTRKCGYFFGVCVDNCGIFDVLCRLQKLYEARKKEKMAMKKTLEKVAEKSKQKLQMEDQTNKEKDAQDEIKTDGKKEESVVNQRSQATKYEPTVVIHLDLFKLACNRGAEALCSEYCCDENKRDTQFCNSKLDCY